MMRSGRLAVFDLDHTLTRRDSYLAYLIGFLLQHPSRIPRAVGLPWQVVLFLAKRRTREDLKRNFLRACLAGMDRKTVQHWTEMFLDRLISRGLRADGLAQVQRHRDQGDVLVLLSASFDFYVEELGRRLGFDETICTQAEWKDERLSGNLAGPNRYGPEKVRSLADLKARYRSATIIAYADHHSDIPFLCQANEGVLINGTARARQLATREGIRCQAWKD